MAIVNPFAGDPERGPAWEQGYLAGYAEPDDEHFPPLEGELLDVFFSGETEGRTDRSNEASSQDAVPSARTSKGPRFETAPDGVLIPIPDELPEGNPVRADARVDVSLQGGGTFYYVVIFNGGNDVLKPDKLLADLVSEAAIKKFEKLLAETVFRHSPKIVSFAAGLSISVAVSIFTSSPILTERRFRAYDENLMPIEYVLLQPRE